MLPNEETQHHRACVQTISQRARWTSSAQVPLHRRPCLFKRQSVLCPVGHETEEHIHTCIPSRAACSEGTRSYRATARAKPRARFQPLPDQDQLAVEARGYEIRILSLVCISIHVMADVVVTAIGLCRRA